MSRGYDIATTFALGTSVIEAMWVPIPIGGAQAQLRRLRVACPQAMLPPQQCLDIVINIVCGSSGGSGGTSPAATPLKHDPGDTPSVAAGLVQLGNTTPNGGGDITDSFQGGDYLWIGDEITFPHPPIVPNGFAIQVLIGPQSASPSPVPQVRVWLEWTETGGPPSAIAPPYVPIGVPLPFTIVPIPAVTSIAPTVGCLVGGTTVTITGSNFSGATAVNFGPILAANFSVVSATQIVAVTPTEPRGTVDVTVSSPAGTSGTSSADQFVFQSVPTVLFLVPATGPLAGGTTVTISGTDFLGASAVTFGTTLAASSVILSGSQILAVSPAQAAATVDVTVTTACGTSATTSADQFTYSGSACPDQPYIGGQGGAPFDTVSSQSAVFPGGHTSANNSMLMVNILMYGSGSGVVSAPSGFAFLNASTFNGGNWTLNTFQRYNAPPTNNTGAFVFNGTYSGVMYLTEVAGATPPIGDSVGAVNTGVGGTALWDACPVQVPCDLGLAIIAYEVTGQSGIPFGSGYTPLAEVLNNGPTGGICIAVNNAVTVPSTTPTAAAANIDAWCTQCITIQPS